MRKFNRENNNAEILFKAIGDLEEDSYKSTGGENIDPTTKAR